MSDCATKINEALALSLARNAALPYGQVLGNDEMENLVNALFACPNVNYTPNGQKFWSFCRKTNWNNNFVDTYILLIVKPLSLKVAPSCRTSETCFNVQESIFADLR